MTLDFEDSNNSLTEEQAIDGLSDLALSDSAKIAFVTLKLPNLGFTDLIGLGLKFTHIQHVDVSKNRLKSLEELVRLEGLRSLNASS